MHPSKPLHLPGYDSEGALHEISQTGGVKQCAVGG